MKKFFLLIMLLFISLNVYANEDLLNLSVNGNAVTCSGYECQIEVDAEEVEITYELGENVKSTTPNSGHKIPLNSNYSLQIEVTYQDDTTANYTLAITKHEKSGDNTLKTLVINDEEVELKEEVYVYSYEAKFNDEKIMVSGTTTDSKASCTKQEYEFDLEKSSLSISYPVTAENGDVRNYTIILKRKNKPDTTLKSLTLSNIELSFDKAVLDYEVTIPYSINTTKIEAIANSSKAKVTIEMEDSFIVGENIIKIIVTNEDATDTYAIRVIRLENLDETLANLKTLEIEGYEFKFDPNKLEYDLIYKEIPSNLIINALALDENAIVTIENNENLEEGSIISIKVSLGNGLVRTYKLNILQENDEEVIINKTLVIILIVILVIVMIILLILQMGDNRKNKRKNKKELKKKTVKKKEETVIKVNEEEEIELI